jgi:amino acid adenylation domain-containing protein/FkbM family methyltransferase
MNNLLKRIGELSPERRELLELRLRNIPESRNEGAPSSQIQRANRSGNLPLSFAQERLWLLDQLEPGNMAYNLPAAIRIRGALDDVVLERVFGEIIRRHEVLRTRFEMRSSGPMLMIDPAAEVQVRKIDLRELAFDEREKQVRELIAVEAQYQFDLRKGPLLRVSLLELEDEVHVLLVTMHHVVSDGWSLGLLVREMLLLHEAFSAGEKSPLPELPVQYADYAVWQRNRLNGEALEELLKYWREKLKDLEALAFPTDWPRHAETRGAGASVSIETDPALTTALKKLAHAEEVTLFTVLSAAFKVLLHRHSGQDDVVVGLPVANRNHSQTEQLIGLFVNTVVLRTDLSGRPTFREALRRERESILGAMAHQDLPFERLVQELQPERDPTRNPIFQVFLNMPQQEGETAIPSRLHYEVLPTPPLPSKFDFTVYMTEQNNALNFELVYASKLFRRERMAELLDQYQRLLRQVVESPDQTIYSYNLRPDQAQGRSSLLTSPSRPVVTPAVHELVDRQARLKPDAVAINDGEALWTYSQVVQLSNRVANCLRQNGVRAGERVLVFACRRANLVPALLGVLKAGGSFVVLDPAYPAARLLRCVALARPGGCLWLEDAGKPPPELRRAIQEIGDCFEMELPSDYAMATKRFREYSATYNETVAEPDAEAYLAFTSGSTGRPKAVMGMHSPLAHFVQWHARQFGLTSEDRFSMLSGLGHDPLLRDIFTPLSIGARVCIPTVDYGAASELAEWVVRTGVTVTHVTPGIGRALCLGTMRNGEPLRFSQVRYAFFGGEALTFADVERFRQTAPDVKCVNFYGATETPQAIASYVVPDGPPTGTYVPIGLGIDGVDLLVTNPAGELVGVGELGEIWVRTPYLSRGYLDDAESTAERFREDWPAPGDRAYRTGDLGRYLGDGNVEFCGRKDQQVKVRGYRIELEEVESVLNGHTLVQQCAVAKMEDESGESSLTAYVVARSGTSVHTADLREHLKGELPDYMVPGRFVFLEHLPLTPNGKVDRKALPKPSRKTEADSVVEPRTRTERLLVDIWREVLKEERVGIQDNFFELGGHSLLAMQLMSRIGHSFGVSLPLKTLFESPTIESLAGNVEKARKGGREIVELSISPVPRDRPLPLSRAQARLWFLYQLNPSGASFNMRSTVRVEGLLDVGKLEQSFLRVVERHEVLRTSFKVIDGVPHQVIVPELKVQFPLLDLSGNPSPEDEALRRIEEEIHTPFDLSCSPLFRGKVLRLAPEIYYLVLTVHHIVGDAWSMGILSEEVATFYRQLSQGKYPDLPDLSIQYGDFANWQSAWLQGDALKSQLTFWKEQLAGELPTLQLPTDRPRPAVQSRAGAVENFNIDAETTEGLRALSQEHGATLFMTLLAGFKVLMHRYSGQEDILVGTHVANRNRLETEGLIGIFINQMVFRTDLSGSPTFLELLRRIREHALEAYMNQDIPFEMIASTIKHARDLSRPAIFQVAFVLEKQVHRDFVLPGLKLKPIRIPQRTANMDMYLSMTESADGLHGSLEYSTDVFEQTSMTRMMNHFRVLLKSIVANPALKLGEIQLFEPEERTRVLKDWNKTAVQYAGDRALHELFEEQVARTPEAAAVVYEGEQLTYRELNERANQLARHLQGLGVGPDVVVPFCMERSLELVIGLMGVLKAGGAYLPLEPNDPVERLTAILAETKAPVILTQQRFVDMCAGAQGIILKLDKFAPGDESKHNPKNGSQAYNLAYVIYTSGSTGRPKGAMNTHRGICNRLQWMQEMYGLNPADRVLQKTPYTFDVSVWEFFWPLLTGARLVLAQPGGQRDPAYLAELVRAQGITTIHFVPSMLQVFLEQGEPQKCSNLKRVICSGEALPYELTRRFHELLGAELHNLYGPTEASVDATYWRCPKVPQGTMVPIGKPIANTQIYILDSQHNPVPIGVNGEIFLGGMGLGRGYWRRPDLTAEKFVPNPFREGARLYRTGDLGRYLEDGNIVWTGRTDHQVKIRGHRIELGEIENALREHEDVKDVAVAVKEGSPGEKRLFAYVVPKNPADLILTEQLYQLPNGLKIAHFHKYETDLFYKEIFEEKTYLKHGLTLSDHSCVFDVGANIGMFTLFVAQNCLNPKIYAFEPSPVFQKLQANLALYGVNATAIRCGLSDVRKTAPLHFYPGMTAMSGAYADASADEATSRAVLKNQQSNLLPYADELLAGKFASETMDCMFKTISDVIAEERIERIDLLKIDAEKSEWDILSGIDAGDWKKIRQVAIEVHDFGGGLDPITELLKVRGFEVIVAEEMMLENTGLYNISAWRPGVRSGNEIRTAHPLELARQPGRLSTELRGYLKQKLPEYMVPARVLVLENFPRTASGKIDRRNLPEEPEERAEAFAAPETPIERRLAEIWKQLLRLDRVGIHDSFFDLGGHSLLATQVINHIQDIFKVKLPLRVLFTTGFTIAELAKIVAEYQLRGLDPEEISALLQQLEEISDSEAQNLVAESTPASL